MFTCLGLPMNRYTFVYFRKPKRFRAQMPTSTSRQTLKDISHDQNFFAKFCRRNFKVKKIMKFRKNTHTHLDPPMHFDFPERMCMHPSPPPPPLSLSLHLQKRFGSRSDPNGIQETMFRQFKNLRMRYKASSRCAR